jgi:hypothetical protein
MKTLSIAAVASALLIATPALAQTFGGVERYGSLGYTNLSFDSIAGFNGKTGDIATGAVTGRLGARRGQNVGVEGELLAGVFHEDVGGANGATVGVNFAATAFLVGFLPVTREVDLFARVGVGAMDVKADAAGATEPEGAGTHGLFAFGGGAQYAFQDVHAVRAEYTRYNVQGGAAEADALTVSYVRKF